MMMPYEWIPAPVTWEQEKRTEQTVAAMLPEERQHYETLSSHLATLIEGVRRAEEKRRLYAAERTVLWKQEAHAAMVKKLAGGSAETVQLPALPSGLTEQQLSKAILDAAKELHELDREGELCRSGMDVLLARGEARMLAGVAA